MKRSTARFATALSIFALCTNAMTAQAGPFADFFRELRHSITHPDEKPRPHHAGRKRSRTSASKGASGDRTSAKVGAPPNGDNTRLASVASDTKRKSDLRYGTPVAGKQGFVTSPFAPDSGYIDVRGFPPGTQVKDPYTGKTFLTP